MAENQLRKQKNMGKWTGLMKSDKNAMGCWEKIQRSLKKYPADGRSEKITDSPRLRSRKNEAARYQRLKRDAFRSRQKQLTEAACGALRSTMNRVPGGQA